MELTTQEQRLSRLLLALSGVFALAFLAQVGLPLFWEDVRVFFVDHAAFAATSATALAALALMSFNAFINVRRNNEITKILLWVLGTVVLVLGALLAFGRPSSVGREILLPALGAFLAIVVLALVFYLPAAKARGDIEVFSEVQRDVFRSLVDAIIPGPDKRAPGATPEALTRRFELFLGSLDPTSKNLLRTGLDVLAPLLRVIGLDPGAASARDALRSRLEDVLDSPGNVLHGPVRLFHIFITYLFYSDPAVDDQLGYVRFKDRKRPGTKSAPETSVIPVRKSIPKRQYDVCIVGSGVAGSLLARRLARAGKSVLVLEAGPYYQESDITDDEFLMFGKLYKADMFGGAVGGSLSVLQARCVGGGAVINNAVCFRVPPFVKREWDTFGAQFSDGDLAHAFETIEKDLGIQPSSRAVEQPDGTFAPLNPSRGKFLEGVQRLGIPTGPGDTRATHPGFRPVSVNLSGCLGCGYCDIGCTYGKKVNTLQKLLPDAASTGNCDIVANAQVDEVLTRRGPGGLSAHGFRVKLKGGKTATATAKCYVLSAGAVASSEILLRSDLADALRLPIGKRFSANVGTLLNARFGERLDAYDGLQVTDYLLEPNADGSWDWMGEVWFNPPGAHSQSIPGYFDTHLDRMKQYSHYAAVGTLVGSQPVGTIHLNMWNRRARLQFDLPLDDLAKLKRGMRRCAEVYFEGGAREIYVMARRDMVLNSKSQLDRIVNEINNPNDLLGLATGHPMGGNAMSDAKDNGRHLGVVGTDFRVHGVDNLYVCDASVFPSSVKVNPQGTIAALAELCADRLLAAF